MTNSEATGEGTPASPEQVAELVRSLATVMRQSGVTELDLGLGPMTLRLRRLERGDTPGPEAIGTAPEVASAEEPADSGHMVTAPMVGTFYAAPSPNASPFIEEGDEVVAGQTIGIIEAMKIMNEIAADRSGIVQEVLARNGQPVEYGSPLVRLSLRRESS